VIIKPKTRGFICITTHPTDCEANIKEQIARVKADGPVANGPKKVLVIGAATLGARKARKGGKKGVGDKA
jgi:enoyl-[acyl-carrier protein] reductase/trans-2-enoyl-CoA reductase (NAD+)